MSMIINGYIKQFHEYAEPLIQLNSGGAWFALNALKNELSNLYGTDIEVELYNVTSIYDKEDRFIVAWIGPHYAIN